MTLDFIPFLYRCPGWNTENEVINECNSSEHLHRYKDARIETKDRYLILHTKMQKCFLTNGYVNCTGDPFTFTGGLELNKSILRKQFLREIFCKACKAQRSKLPLSRWFSIEEHLSTLINCIQYEKSFIKCLYSNKCMFTTVNLKRNLFIITLFLACEYMKISRRMERLQVMVKYNFRKLGRFSKLLQISLAFLIRFGS